MNDITFVGNILNIYSFRSLLLNFNKSVPCVWVGCLNYFCFVG